MNDSKRFTREGLAAIIDRLPLSISVIDRDRRVILANKATLRFTNSRQRRLIGKVGGQAFECINADAVPEGCGFGPECLGCKLRQTVVDTLSTGTPHQTVETSMTFKNRGRLYLRISTLPLTLDSQDVSLLTIEDVTRERLHEKTVVEKERLRAAVETAGAVCHEMNQPLQVMLLSLEMLAAGAGADQADRIKDLTDEVMKMGAITKKLKDIVSFKTKKYIENIEILDLDRSTRKKARRRA